jgi:hypothetical protein
MHKDHTQIEYYTKEPEDVEPTDDEVRITINALTTIIHQAKIA